MNIKKTTGIFFIAASLLAHSLMARETVYSNKKKINTPPAPSKSMAGCDPATAQIELDINNVRALLFNGGDMWWEGGGGDARYEIPKVGPTDKKIHSLFAGALWFGGVDDANQLKTAGQTYRQFSSGAQGANDFWPGPLDTANASIDAEECLKWDNMFKVTREEIDAMRLGGPVTAALASWPAHGDLSKNQARFLAPFVDANGNGLYEPGATEYPYLGLGCDATQSVIPDQMIWWVYNDKGNVHQKYPGGEPIGLEVHAMAFAFKTANVVNNMTFYRYKIFNRASSPLNDTYFAQWVDADLGNPADDYAGCDVDRSLGYVYNGDGTDEDGVANGYGAIPPAVGIDFFRGPKDENGNEIPLSKFMYFTNSAPPSQDDPDDATELYRYLRGIWADGTPLSYGGTGYNTSNNDFADYAFPGTTDPLGRPEWSESGLGNAVGDRRIVQSVGPFRLLPGAVNEVIVGAVWARASSGDQLTSLNLLKDASDKAQILFDNCFRLASGPDPVTMKIVEQENKLILALENKTTESYNQVELDDEDLKKYRYKFQGYRIYQVKSSGVTDLTDDTQAKEIFTVDIKDGVTRIINKRLDKITNNIQAEVMVEGSDNGIRHTFEITKDAFSLSSDNSLVNYKTYYFTVIPYAYSDSAAYTKYLPSRSSGAVVSGIPHKPLINNYVNNQLLTSVPMTRIEGKGNGGNVLDITEETRAEILQNGRSLNPDYLAGKGPITVKVYDPKAVPNHEFELLVNPDYSGWRLIDMTTKDTTFSDAPLGENEQVIYADPKANPRVSLGFTVMVNQSVANPGASPGTDPNNGFLEATMEFADPENPWFEPLVNSEVTSSPSHWMVHDAVKDPQKVYKKVLGGTFSPYKLVEVTDQGPGFNALSRSQNVMENTGSVDLIITNDKSKWSQCIVVESGDDDDSTEGNAKRLFLRNKDIGKGMSRSEFPGYAINLETGERVNIFFAESSMLPEENGADMLFNPTSNKTGGVNGGKHYLYIHRTKYDSCKTIQTLLNGGLSNKNSVYANVDWLAIPMLKRNQSIAKPEDIPCDVKVRLRVNKTYSDYATSSTPKNSDAPYYTFNTSEIVKAFNQSKDVTNEDALKLINIVPNPYYSFSGYEATRNDFKVRITNLPKTAIVSIYTSNGLLVRKLRKDDPDQTYIDWDLQNSNQVPIASGMYLIHINVPDVGERTLKWFGVMRPLDFENF